VKALVFERFGEPGEVLRLAEVPMPEPGPGQVRVRMIASPVNPSDLLVVRGRYVVLPTPPATPGFEGVGVVDKAGPGLLGRLVVGKRVVAINDAGGNWAEYALIHARQARPVPDDIPDDQAASFFVNPATALALVRHVLEVPRGAWLLQTAANSALGRMIIRLARHDGIRTLNIVRRPELASELESLGADRVVVAENGQFADEVGRIVGAASLGHAIDPVGGAMGTEALRCLGPGGRLIVYGSLTNQPLSVDPRPLITRAIRIESFWLGRWMRSRWIPENLRLFREIARLIRAGVLTTEPGRLLALDQWREAVQGAEAGGRRGKILLAPTSATTGS
jgi:NADPH:quinone reductase-like Zn-dependent oxidoreductase